MSARPRRTLRAAPCPIAVLALALAGCFVNDAAESAGNSGRQDSGLHIRLDGNFVLNADGSRVVTTASLAVGDPADGARVTHLIGVAIPSLAVRVGPAVDHLDGVEIMLTPNPDRAWLIGRVDQRLSIAPLDLPAMTLGAPLDLPPGKLDAAILAGDGRKLAVGKVWDVDPATRLSLLDVPLGPSELGPDPLTAPVDVPLDGALFDARFTRDGSRLVTLTVPTDANGHYLRAATVTVFATDAPRHVDELARFELPDFSLNLLGIFTWSIRISPDGRWAAVSGRQGEAQTTHVFDLTLNAHHDALPCDGPVGFTPDSAAVVGFRDAPGDASELVITDLASGTSESAPLAYEHPVYWVSPAGGVVVTYPFGERGLVITDLDTLESVQTTGEAVGLREFVVSPDADFVYLVDRGALYLLDIDSSEIVELEPRDRDYDNLNILPDADTLVLSAEDTTRFDLWSVTTASTVASARLPDRR